MKITEKIAAKCADNYSQPPIFFGFLGDSVTQGCFELYAKNTKSDNNGYETEFCSTDGYSTKLKTLIETVMPQVTVNILNAGISGDNAPNAAKRVDRDIIAHNPDLCVVCFGLNDATKGTDGIEKYKNGLDTIFKKLKKAEIETIFMTPNMMADYVTAEITRKSQIELYADMIEKTGNGIFEMYMDAAREVCKENNVALCDCYKKWQKLNSLGVDTTRLLSNRINHPTEKMHWLFAISLFEMIMEL